MLLISPEYYTIHKTKHKGRGIFAVKEIKGGTVIGDYLGKLVSVRNESKYKGMYGMWYNDRATIVIEDVKKTGAHLINHSCIPNCAMYTYKKHTLIFALRKIFPGEELTYSYLLDPPDSNKEPAYMHSCICGSEFCTTSFHVNSFISKKWEHFVKSKYPNDFNKTEIPFNNNLPVLKNYPESIDDNEIYDMYADFSHSPEIIEDTVMPDKKKVRKLIRETGKILEYKKMKIKIFGIRNGYLLIK